MEHALSHPAHPEGQEGSISGVQLAVVRFVCLAMGSAEGVLGALTVSAAVTI